MNTLFQRASDRFRELRNLAPEAPVLLAVVGVAFVLGPPIVSSILSWGAARILSILLSILPGENPVQQVSFPTGFPNPFSIRPDDPVLGFAFIVCSYCLGICTILLLVAFPIYIFSSSPARSKRAGYVVNATLTFIITSGGGVMAYLGFTKGR